MNQPPRPPRQPDEPARIVRRFDHVVAATVQAWLAGKPRAADFDDRPWVLAVSGGADSMAMLHAIVRGFKRKPVLVAHMNHHARDESDVDESFVRQAAERLGVPFEAGHWRPVRVSHFEADARRARHDWLAELATRTNAAAVMTAHTRDDQVETVLMRLARGTGPWGVSGIRPWRTLPNSPSNLVRPMLNVGRADVVDYLNALGVTFRDDPTNFDTENQDRSWIRHVIVPQIENRLNPRFRLAIAQFADLQQEEQAGLECMIRRRANRLRVAICEPGTIRIDLRVYPRFGRSWLRRRLLRKLWAESGLPQRSMAKHHWVELDRVLIDRVQPGDLRQYPLPGKVALTNSGQEAVLTSIAREPNSDSIAETGRISQHMSGKVELSCPGLLEIDGFRIVVEASDTVPDVEMLRRTAGRIAALDAASLQPPVVIRRPMAGDRFDPVGMGGKHQKLVDYLRNRGVRGRDKVRVWVLEDRAGIVHVVGHGVSDRAKVRPVTGSVWMIRAEPLDEDETKVASP